MQSDDTPDVGAHPFQICFVCAGNICRSPMAEVVLSERIESAGLGRYVSVTSAGIGDWHVGEEADRRTIAALRRHGYTRETARARQFDPAWYSSLDLVVALDRGHQRVLHRWAPTDVDRGKVATLLSFDPAHSDNDDVPDPYYAGDEMFDEVLGMIEKASTHLFRQIEPAIRLGATR